MVLKAGRYCIMLKRDMKDAFRMIPIAPQHHWLMGFSWNGKFYVEQVLSFGLRTAPIIFNLFAEAWEWIVRSHLRWHLIEHYLDDMMAGSQIHRENGSPNSKGTTPSSVTSLESLEMTTRMRKALPSSFWAGW